MSDKAISSYYSVQVARMSKINHIRRTRFACLLFSALPRALLGYAPLFHLRCCRVEGACGLQLPQAP